MSFGEAVDHLYAVFATVPRPPRVEACPHCVGPDDVLPTGPVRRLPADKLAGYAAKAMTTWGTVQDFRHFVPRLLECAAADEFVWPDPESVFHKLAYAGWTRWSPEEREAIGKFMSEWSADALRTYPSRPTIGTIIGCVGAARGDVTGFLREWGNSLEFEAAIRHLNEFVRELDHPYHWERPDIPFKQIIAWLTGDELERNIEDAFARENRDDLLELLVHISDARSALPPAG